jgi:hypothetical protein
MKPNRAFSMLAATLTCLLVASIGNAGQDCGDQKTNVTEFASAMAQAERMEGALSRLNINHAIVARVGSDLSEHGLKYTHLGIAERVGASGHWRVIHQLNPCGTGTSVLRRDGLGVFLMDDLYSHDLLLVPLEVHASEALSRMEGTDLAVRLHEPRYSMIAYPGPDARYQNSNQWILELITQAVMVREGYATPDRHQVQRRYLRDGFMGSMVRIGFLERAVAGIGAPNIRFDDHPRLSMISGRFEVVSVSSVVSHLARNGMLGKPRELRSEFRRDQRWTPRSVIFSRRHTLPYQ